MDHLVWMNQDDCRGYQMMLMVAIVRIVVAVLQIDVDLDSLAFVERPIDFHMGLHLVKDIDYLVHSNWMVVVVYFHSYCMESIDMLEEHCIDLVAAGRIHMRMMVENNALVELVVVNCSSYL